MKEKNKSSKLSWLCGLGSALTLVMAFVIRFIAISQGSFSGDIIYKSITVSITAGFLIGVIAVYQLLAYIILKNRLKNHVIMAVILLMPGILLGGYVLRSSLPTVRANGILAWAKLAPLPKSAEIIKVYSWSSPFSGEDYLVFRAERQVLEKYIDDCSSVLSKATCEIYSKDRMRLYYPEDYSKSTEKLNEVYNSSHEYIYRMGLQLDWYDEEIKEGRRYEFDVKGHQFPGELIWNQETNTIYINLCFS